MKAKRSIFIFSCISSILSLLLSIICFQFLEENIWFDFLKDLFLGVFGGTVVSIVIALIEYNDCKKKNLEQLFDAFCKQRREFNKILYFDSKTKDNTNCLDSIDNVIKSYQSVKYYHSIIGNTIADTSFIYCKSKKFEKLMSYYQMIKSVNHKYIEANFHFENYQKGECQKSTIVTFIIDLQKQFFDITEHDSGNMKITNVFAKQNKNIDSALDLIGELCYGKKYIKNTKNTMNDENYIVSSNCRKIQ